jgi:hypothetical protein
VRVSTGDFQTLPSGLLVPARSRVRDKHHPGSRTAGGLARPDSVVQIACNWQELIGTGPEHLEDILEQIRELPFQPAMSYLSMLATGLYHARRETHLHLHLAHEAFGDGPVFKLIQRWLAAGPDRLVFDQRHLTVLQRLLVEHARETPVEILSDHERAVLLYCLVAIGDVLPEWSPPELDANGDYDTTAWTIYAVQRGAYYNHPELYEGIVRTHTMLVEIAGEPDLVGHHQYCPLERWASEDCGASLSDQLASGFALAVGTRILDPRLTLAQRTVTVSAGFLRDTPFAPHESEIFTAVSATRQQLQAAFVKAGGSDEHLAWDHAPFDQRPFLRRPDGTLTLISPTSLAAWMSNGLYFRMLDAASEHQQVRRFTAFNGVLAERYAHRLIAASHEVSPHRAVISPDQPYRIGRRELRSPDVAIAQPPDLVLFEAYSGRIPREARVAASAETVQAALEKMILDKLTELQDRIADLLDRRFEVPGAGELESIRIWPVVLLAGDAVFQAPMLWRWLAQRLPPGALSDPRVRPPTVCSLDDLDPLLVLVQRGETLPQLLAEFHHSQHATLPPRNWIAAARPLYLHDRPQYVEERYREIMDGARRRLSPKT